MKTSNLTGGVLIPAELQAECELAMTMPVYPPQPPGTVMRPIIGSIGPPIVVPPDPRIDAGELCERCGKNEAEQVYDGRGSDKHVCWDCLREYRMEE